MNWVPRKTEVETPGSCKGGNGSGYHNPGFIYFVILGIEPRASLMLG
jgi:hypothetical protein